MKVCSQRVVTQQLFERVKPRRQRDLVVGSVNALMAFTTYVNTDIELFLGESFSEALSTMHFSWDEMVKSERHHAATACTGQYRFLFTHSGRSLSADSHLVDQTAKFIAIGANA